MAAPRILSILNRYDLKTSALLHAVSEQRQRALTHASEGLAAQVCSAYLKGDGQTRLVIVRTIGRKAALLGHLFTFAEHCIDEAEMAHAAGKARRAAAQLRLGIVADTILDGRIEETYLKPIQDRMIGLALALGFDLPSLAGELDVPLADSIRSIHAALRRRDHDEAFDALTRLLYRNPELEDDPAFVAAAEAATGKAGYAAVATLRDRDLRWRALESQRETVERRGITRLSDKLYALRQQQEISDANLRLALA